MLVGVLVVVRVPNSCVVADGAATPVVGLEVLSSNWVHVLDIGDVLHREVVLTWWQRMVWSSLCCR